MFRDFVNIVWKGNIGFIKVIIIVLMMVDEVVFLLFIIEVVVVEILVEGKDLEMGVNGGMGVV